MAGSGCQAAPAGPAADDPRATADLKLLVSRFQGKPSGSDLAAFEVSHPNTRAAALARFLRGYLAFGSADYLSAATALDPDEIGKTSSLGDYAALYRGRAEIKLGRSKDAERTLSRVREKFPDSMLSRDATMEAARAALGAGDEKAAADDLEALSAQNDPEALLLWGGLRAGKGDTGAAIRLFRSAYFGAPASTEAGSALAQLRLLGADPETSPASEDELRMRADRLYTAQAWGAASTAYGRLLAAYPNVKDRDALNLRRGIAAGNARDAATAAASLLTVSTADPNVHAEALYRLATAYRIAGMGPEFESTGARLRSQYPTSDWTGKYLGDYADYLEKKNRTAELFAVQRALVTGFPRIDKAAEASYDLAWLAFKTHDYARAADLFLEHLATFTTPTTKWVGESAFWGGRAYEYTGNRQRALFMYDLAARRYPYGYHGVVASTRAKDLVRRTPNLVAEAAPAGSQLARASQNALAVQPIVETSDERATPRISHAEDLRTIALYDLAIAELTKAQTLFPDSPLVNLRLAQVFNARGDMFQATVVFRKGYPDIYSYRDDQVPREGWEVMFPLTNWETIKAQATAQGIDPFVVAGLIRQESVYNPRALSRANARGLMQLLPSTARLVGKTNGLGGVTAADLFTPTINITLGTAYFAQQVRNFGGVEYAAAAYNAGPGRVIQWKAARPGAPIEEWVENIPISETRGYVQGVLRYAANYRRFYGREQERAVGQ